jgi:hypothetical protein
VKIQTILDQEVSDVATGAILAEVDTAWPRGVQEEYSEPGALLLEPEDLAEERLNAAGYRYFTGVSALRHYLEACYGSDVEEMAAHAV